MSSHTLRDALVADGKRPAFIADCAKLLDEEVKAKSGLTGMALKGAYKTVQKIKPGFVEGVMDFLLDEWLEELEAFYVAHEASAATEAFGHHLLERKNEVAECLLSVTDRRAENTEHKAIGKLYARLRGGAKGHVVQALPRAVVVLDRHLAN